MVSDSGTVALPEGVYEHDGLLWRAKPGASSTFEESVAARDLFLELHSDEFWNPWRMEEQAAELERAEQIMGEWRRAEPGFRPRTKRQMEAEFNRWDREFERKKVEREARRLENLKRYDPDREKARLSLLEQQSILD